MVDKQSFSPESMPDPAEEFAGQLFEPTNVRFRDHLSAYEAQVEKIRKARILKFRIKWMGALIQQAQVDLAGIDANPNIDQWMLTDDVGNPLSDPNLAIAIGEQPHKGGEPV